MIVGVQGTNSFTDYNVFLRAMAVALSELEDKDKEFILYSDGPSNITMMAMEFTNLSERGMKLRGKKIKLIKVTSEWLKENSDLIDHLIFLSKPKEPVSWFMNNAKNKNLNVNVYNF